MMADCQKPFNTKSELFTEYSEKNRYLLDLIKKERRKIIDERSLKKNKCQKNITDNNKRKNIQKNLNSFNKTVKMNSKLKEIKKDNIFSPKNKMQIQNGGY